MIIGYARTSTLEQVAGFEAQIRELEAAGCERLYKEQVSSVAQRAQLDAALDFVREGDTFMVTKLDRLARSMAHLMQIVEGLRNKGVRLVIRDMNLDTGSATGGLILGVLGSVAQWERLVMLERQRLGIAKAKADGKYTGRKPTARAKTAQVVELFASGVRKADIARDLKISLASVYRILPGGGADKLAAD